MSERKLATIRTISDVNPIPGADAIEVATVDGWKVVIKKNEFKAGDLCIYLEIDSFLPIRPEYEFLRKSSYKKFPNGIEGFRLKTARLRGQISQGLILPLSMLKIKGKAGDDVTAKLKIQKYEPEILGQAHLVKPWYIRKLHHLKYLIASLFMFKAEKRKRGGSFPSFMPKTDEERIQNLDITKFQGQVYEETEKLDGISATYAYNSEFYVCSRNCRLGLVTNEKGEPTGMFDGAYWKMALKYDLEAKLKKLADDEGIRLAVQGEILGPGIQKNKYGLKEHNLYVFRIYDIGEKRFLTPAERKRVCADMGLKHVPVLDVRVFDYADVDAVLAHADGVSMVGEFPRSNREGIVFKAVDGSHSFKVISNKFLLKNEE